MGLIRRSSASKPEEGPCDVPQASSTFERTVGRVHEHMWRAMEGLSDLTRHLGRTAKRRKYCAATGLIEALTSIGSLCVGFEVQSLRMARQSSDSLMM